MTILITGGSGMLGKHLNHLFPEAFCCSSHDADLRDLNQVDALFKHHKPKLVIHAAARVGGIQDNIQYPADYFDDNILINTNVVRMCHRHAVHRLIGILSTCIYPDNVDHYPMGIGSIFSGPPTPTNFSYAYSKRALAVQIDAYNQQFGYQWNYVIPCNLFSELDNFSNQSKMHFITALLKKIKTSKSNLNLLGTGKPLRQFIYAGDCAKVIQLMIANNITEHLNIAPKYNYSIHKMAQMALDAVGKSLPIVYSNPELDGQYRKDVDASRLTELFPSFEFSDFKAMLKVVYDKIS